MIVGVGIDMIEVDRVMEKINKNVAFKEKIFSPDEIAFCETKVNKGENYAARFAAKEAFLKATGMGLSLGHDLADIEIATDENGKPYILLKGSFQEKATKNSWTRVHVSLSHLHSIACAVVIIEQ
jgi:holo-[acyl-carrier protein] synthase